MKAESFFIKCSECRAKPATIRCFDCKVQFGSNLNKFCYSCDSKLHSSQKEQAHKKEIIPYSEMYNKERDKDKYSSKGSPFSVNKFTPKSESTYLKQDAFAGSTLTNREKSGEGERSGSYFGKVSFNVGSLRQSPPRNQSIENERRKKEIMSKITQLNEKLSPKSDYAQRGSQHASGGAALLWSGKGSGHERSTPALSGKASGYSPAHEPVRDASPFSSKLRVASQQAESKEFTPKDSTQSLMARRLDGGNLDELSDRLRVQELQSEIKRLNFQLDGQKKQSELELRKLREEHERKAGEQEERLGEQFAQFFEQRLQEEREKYEASLADLQSRLQVQMQRNADLISQFERERTAYESEIKELEHNFKEVEQNYQQQIDQQQVLIQELQETDRQLMEDPVFKLLKDNPEFLENLKNGLEQSDQQSSGSAESAGGREAEGARRNFSRQQQDREDAQQDEQQDGEGHYEDENNQQINMDQLQEVFQAQQEEIDGLREGNRNKEEELYKMVELIENMKSIIEQERNDKDGLREKCMQYEQIFKEHMQGRDNEDDQNEKYEEEQGDDDYQEHLEQIDELENDYRLQHQINDDDEEEEEDGDQRIMRADLTDDDQDQQ